MLRVAIGERDAVPLLVQPGGQVNGERRFADASFGIRDHDNLPIKNHEDEFISLDLR